jgi:maltose O-acetyltransferase
MNENIIIILKKVHRFFNAIKRYLIKNTIYFYIPNFINIFVLKRIILGKQNGFNQRTYITGKGKVITGDYVLYGSKLGGHWRKGSVEIQARYRESLIKIESNVSMNNNIFICCKKYIEIGEYTLIGRDCEFLDFDAHGIAPSDRRTSTGLEGEIIIGKNVWFGNNCTVLRGTTVGDNSIIASGSVVKGKFPSNVILGGVPARIIKQIE